MILLFLALAASSACPYPTDRGTVIATRQDLPASALTVFGELADKGEPFQASDLLPAGHHLPFSRFVAAEAQGCGLTLHYEHGGIGHSWPTARFHFADGRWALLSRYDPR